MAEVTKERLEALLREAKKAHGEYEKQTGRPDEDWPAWYAEYIAKRL